MKRVKFLPFWGMVVCAYVFYLVPTKYFSWYLYLVSSMFLLLLFCLPLIAKDNDGGYTLIKMAAVAKLVLIPWYGINFLSAVWLMLSSLVIPIGLFGLPVVAVINIVMLFVTSLYMVAGIHVFCKSGVLPGKVALICMQLIFVADVIGGVVAWLVASRQKNNFFG